MGTIFSDGGLCPDPARSTPCQAFIRRCDLIRIWLVTTQGFYSVVADRDDDETLRVRARTREDIEALREQIPALEPYDDPAADYRWRAEVSRDDWKKALAALAEAVDYDNFKTAVSIRQGPTRHDLYAEIWRVLARLQRER